VEIREVSLADDLVLFPHCDVHVALHGAPELKIRVCKLSLAANNTYTLTPVTSQCKFDLFAPYNPVGNRLQAFVTIDPATGLVTPVALGINLVQVRLDDYYIIARIQVHDSILGWWFGNPSITTAVDNQFAHAQPSIYALFSDDGPVGTDLVGDITGHGYVTLTSASPAVFAVNADGRLQGISEGAGTLTGSFLGVNHSLDVQSVNYGKTRTTLGAVRPSNTANVSEMHNILFIPEGFRDSADDRTKFDEVVTKVVHDLFSKPRHAPFDLLARSFNVWKAYEPSKQYALTCGFRINDQDTGELSKGFPIPYGDPLKTDRTEYTLELLIRRVGLPERNENRDPATLRNLWSSQSLNDFDASQVSDPLIAAWKAQTSLGILETRDTFFGLQLGQRYADRSSGSSNPIRMPPAKDSTDQQNRQTLKDFVARVYEWFNWHPPRHVSPDPRRHPPELPAANAIMNYMSSLQWAGPPSVPVGPEWVPDPSGRVFKRSLGLVAIIVNDGLDGGTNFGTATANTLAKLTQVSFSYFSTGNERPMRRTPPATIDEDIDEIINTVAHEFGHSFNLGDEYEEFPGNDPGAIEVNNLDLDWSPDNVARLSKVYLTATTVTDAQGRKTLNFGDNKIDPSKVKWFNLLRAQLSDTLTSSATATGTLIEVSIDKQHIASWIAAKDMGSKVFLRKSQIAAVGRQLPLETSDAFHLDQMTIQQIDESKGTILLGIAVPSTSTFPRGSVLYIPLRYPNGDVMHIVEAKVLDWLKQNNTVLNEDRDIRNVNKEEDDPVDIPGFHTPCKSYKVIGIYEGAEKYSGMDYRPAGLCKMRKGSDVGTGDGEFCHVCKYLIVQRVDPSLLALLDANYYPTAKKEKKNA
jgi:hypothetical protein